MSSLKELTALSETLNGLASTIEEINLSLTSTRKKLSYGKDKNEKLSILLLKWKYELSQSAVKIDKVKSEVELWDKNNA